MVNLAFDLGASSGRAIVGELKNDKLEIFEIHRFPNDPVKLGDHFYWDILRLFYEIKEGLLQSKKKGYEIHTLGIDTWGLDFGLIDENGELIGNPYHYRDKQSVGMVEKVCEIIPKSEIYGQTGIQFMNVNSLYHLYAMKCSNSTALKRALTFLPIADILRYFLTGKKTAEVTITSTTQLYNSVENRWVTSIVERLGLPTDIFPKVIESGTIAGTLTPAICSELQLQPVQVIAVGEHDTASAVAAIPIMEKDFAYLSCGTWSLLGTELEEPIINEQALKMNFTNEKGVYNSYRLLKNIMGLWLIQECKQSWEKEGINLTYNGMTKLALEAEPFYAFVDPDDEVFLNPNNMPMQIQQFCQETNQPVPKTKGQIIRCIIESLALKYRFVLNDIEVLTGRRYQGLHIVGGGVKNELLCQFTANAIARPVWAGPEEATAIGNILVQMIATGKIKDLQAGRDLVKKSFYVKTFEPLKTEKWEEAFKTFIKLLEKSKNCKVNK
ncbi:rhamnulokinase [Bacillus sp. REN16]|uniref:rhamnulokinase n=1 Tax=Bacillus sp. REN16 TaxID=2887296 RepID=UPI003B637C06